MQAKLIDDHDQRVFAVIFDTGEDPMAGLARFAGEHNLSASSFTAIGAFSEATLGYFDWEKKDYERIAVREQVEVLSLIGDIADRVRPTLEVIITESPGYLQRKHDPASGLSLIKIS